MRHARIRAERGLGDQVTSLPRLLLALEHDVVAIEVDLAVELSYLLERVSRLLISLLRLEPFG